MSLALNFIASSYRFFKQSTLISEKRSYRLTKSCFEAMKFLQVAYIRFSLSIKVANATSKPSSIR